jgi:hypothetical protein
LNVEIVACGRHRVGRASNRNMFTVAETLKAFISIDRSTLMKMM